MGEEFVSHYDVSASALTAERARMRIIASNVANVNATRSLDGGPYKRQVALLETQQRDGSTLDAGVRIQKIEVDSSPPRLVYEPEHPDANNDGYVAYPNIDLLREVTDMKTATLAYQANISVVEATKKMIRKVRIFTFWVVKI